MLVKRLNHLFTSILFVFCFMFCFSCNDVIFDNIMNIITRYDFKPFELQKHQVTTPLDILIVVDTSGSMSQEQNEVKRQFPNLLDKIKDKANWRIAVTTTDAADLCLRSHKETQPSSLTTPEDFIITSETNREEAANQFSRLINAGIKGSGAEEGLYRALQALNRDTTNSCVFNDGSTFYRNDSKLVIIVVSDEFSDVKKDPTANKFSINSEKMNMKNQVDIFIRELSTLRTNPSDFKVYGFLNLTGFNPDNYSVEALTNMVVTSCPEYSTYDKPESYCPAYSAVIKKTGGLIKNITSTSAYEDAFKTISNDIATSLLSELKYEIEAKGNVIDNVRLGRMVNNVFVSELELTPSQYRYVLNNKEAWVEITDKTINLTKYTHIKLN